MADLATAKKDAATRSLESKKVLFIEQLDSGECEIVTKQNKNCLHAFKDGNEIPVPEMKEDKPKEKKAATKTKVQTKPKKKMAKKAAKKPAKKAEKKSTSGLIGKGTTVSLSKSQWDKLHKMGNIRQLVTDAVVKTYKL